MTAHERETQERLKRTTWINWIRNRCDVPRSVPSRTTALTGVIKQANLVFSKTNLTGHETLLWSKILKCPGFTLPKLQQLRASVDECLRNRRVFMMRNGHVAIRKALVARGWIEKFECPGANPFCGTYNPPDAAATKKLYAAIPRLLDYASPVRTDKIITSLMLHHVHPHFFWSNTYVSGLPITTLFNRLDNCSFTLKSGLCAVFDQFHWHYEPGVSEVSFPRTYHLWDAGSIKSFTEDFQITACMSLLKNFVTKVDKNGASNVRGRSGTIPSSCIDFAIKRCEEFLWNLRQEDCADVEPIKYVHDWDFFLNGHQAFLTGKQKFTRNDKIATKTLYANSTNILAQMKQACPQYEMDGMRNVWIIKPENQTRGIGIHTTNRLLDIVSILSDHTVGHYVIQKYIEKPLLIYDTKFDIRQWFLVTSIEPMIIWMYRNSYLRFCSQKYTLTSFCEVIHLTNHAVQKKYPNGIRSKAIPVDNMWDSNTFQEYLQLRGLGHKWNEVIYPGMRKAIVATLLASQEGLPHRPFSFQLYGADFTLDENCTPWLIEMNQSPEMGGMSSKVTAKLSPECLADIIKVVIDHRNNPAAPTGAFELIYHQFWADYPASSDAGFLLTGTSVPVSKKTVGKIQRASVTLLPDSVSVDWQNESMAKYSYYDCGVQFARNEGVTPTRSRYLLGVLRKIRLIRPRRLDSYKSCSSRKLKHLMAIKVAPRVKKRRPKGHVKIFYSFRHYHFIPSARVVK